MAKNYSKAGRALIVVAIIAGIAAGLAFNSLQSRASRGEVQTFEGPGAVSAPGDATNPAPTVSIGPPAIPADHAGRTACRACHESGLAGAPRFPANHVDRTDAVCLACHRPG